MGTGIPPEAIGASAAVLVFSTISFILVALLVCMLWAYGERWTYVAFLANSSALSTLGSIGQQIHYNRSWLTIKHDVYVTALRSVDKPALALSGVGNDVDLVLYTVQFYSYNVMALMVLFWAVKLFCGSWEIRASFLGSWMREHISFMSKIFAIIVPALLVGLGHTPIVLKSYVASFILSNITMLVSLSVGSVLMVLILYKYIRTRRLLFAHETRNGWWRSSGTATATNTTGTGKVNGSGSGIGSGIGSGSGNDNYISTRRSLYDRALITRFTIGFVILLVLEVVLILFTLSSVSNFRKLAKSSSPDFSISGCITDILLFIPGVSTSMLVFLVFGTSKSFVQYRSLITSGCGRRKPFNKSKQRGVMRSRDEEQGTEFQRLASMGKKVLTPEEQVVLEAKTRGMLPDQRTSVATQYTMHITYTGKNRPESSIYTYNPTRPLSPLSPVTTNFNFNLPAGAKNIIQPVIREEERDAGEDWARQNDLEIGLAVEQAWSAGAYKSQRESAGDLSTHGDRDPKLQRDFILDDSDEHEG